MTSEKIFEKLRTYIEYEMRVYKDFGKAHGASPKQMLDRCYGAVMYSATLIPEIEEEVGKWWDDEARPALYELLNDCSN